MPTNVAIHPRAGPNDDIWRQKRAQLRSSCHAQAERAGSVLTETFQHDNTHGKDKKISESLG